MDCTDEDRAPEGYIGWDGQGALYGGRPEFYLGVSLHYDGPAHVPAWACSTCGAIVPIALLDLHRASHHLPARRTLP